MALTSSQVRPENPTRDTDPFYRSPLCNNHTTTTPTPTPNSPGSSTFGALMAAAQQLNPNKPHAVAPAMSSQRASRYGTPTRRSQCTHTTMNRVHGLTCSMCYRAPGSVYQCRQDDQYPQHEPLPDIHRKPLILDDGDSFDAKARLAEYLKMSPAVITGIQRADYNMDQVGKLIKQRETLIQAINEKDTNATSSIEFSFNSQDTIASAGSNGPLSHQKSQPNVLGPFANTAQPNALSAPTQRHSIATQKSLSKCTFTVCQSCRPYFRDRIWASMESVLKGDYPPLTELEMRSLPMMDPQLALNIGLRATPSQTLHSIPSQQSMQVNLPDTSDEISVDWTHTTNEAESDSGSDALDSELFPCPGPLHCPVWSRQSGCAYDTGFDDGRRAENHGFFARLTPEESSAHLGNFTSNFCSTPARSSSTASSVSLPSTPISPFTPLSPTDDTLNVTLEKRFGSAIRAKSVCGDLDRGHRRLDLRGNHSRESLGSGMEVDDGATTTPEAIKPCPSDIAHP